MDSVTVKFGEKKYFDLNNGFARVINGDGKMEPSFVTDLIADDSFHTDPNELVTDIMDYRIFMLITDPLPLGNNNFGKCWDKPTSFYQTDDQIGSDNYIFATCMTNPELHNTVRYDTGTHKIELSLGTGPTYQTITATFNPKTRTINPDTIEENMIVYHNVNKE